MIQQMTDRALTAERIRIACLLCLHTAICCVSLFFVADRTFFQYVVDPAPFHIFFDPARLIIAIAAVTAFAAVSVAFCFARFSFGYAIGFYFYTMISGYLWLNCFSDLPYDHKSSALSAAISAVTFLLPALFIVSPIRQVYAMSAGAFDRMLMVILLLAAAVVIWGALYNFRIVGIKDIYDFRDGMESPAIVNYLVAISSGALLPFAFAGFIARKAYWRASIALVLLLLFFPVTLSKLALFAPLWLIGMLFLSRIFDTKIAVIISLLGPAVVGLILHMLFTAKTSLYYSIVNFRLLAVPANALDIYNDYFSRHDPTYFCQISIVRRIMQCPVQEPLWIVMEKAYNLGNLNASLFATEGLASVGLLFAPVATFGCGLVIALGNRLSAGLPPRFILLSGAVLLPILLNVPLSIVLNTHGAALLFLLWYMTPRAIFEKDGTAAGEDRMTMIQASH
jgi:hypothetical protein